jgi:hypothetical protein
MKSQRETTRRYAVVSRVGRRGPWDFEQEGIEGFGAAIRKAKAFAEAHPDRQVQVWVHLTATKVATKIR